MSENGREIDGLDDKSELAHRMMLVNLLLFQRWASEHWGEYLCLAGAVWRFNKWKGNHHLYEIPWTCRTKLKSVTVTCSGQLSKFFFFAILHFIFIFFFFFLSCLSNLNDHSSRNNLFQLIWLNSYFILLPLLFRYSVAWYTPPKCAVHVYTPFFSFFTFTCFVAQLQKENSKMK